MWLEDSPVKTQSRPVSTKNVLPWQSPLGTSFISQAVKHIQMHPSPNLQ